MRCRCRNSAISNDVTVHYTLLLLLIVAVHLGYSDFFLIAYIGSFISKVNADALESLTRKCFVNNDDSESDEAVIIIITCSCCNWI